MFEYRVGKIYHAGKTRWQDGTDFNFRSGVLELRMFFSKLTHSDIRAIKNGACTFHLAVTGNVIWFLFEFGNACPLSDNSYTIHMVAENEQTLPPILGQGESSILTIILVSSEDGIIRAMRQISLGHDFSVALFDAIREQAQRPFNQAEHDRVIAETYSRYPSSQALKRIAIATSIVAGNESKN